MEVSVKKLVIGLVIVFLLGVMFAVVNGVYATEQGNALPIITYAIAFVSLIAGGFIVVLFQWKINKVQLQKITRILPHDERIVIRILMEHNNEIEQNKLVLLSGLNKVKISRLVEELKRRGVVDKKHLGNTNLVILKI